MIKFVKLKDRGIKYEIDKFGFKKRIYKIKSSTKKCKELKRKIEKADKQIIEAKLLCIEERKKLICHKLKVQNTIKLRIKQKKDKVKQMNIERLKNE